MQLKPGVRLRSAVCTTEVMVVRAPAADVDLTCGGVPMLTPDAPKPDSPGAVPDGSEGTGMGKRYADEELGLELLCTKAGPGDLAVNGTRLPLKGAKPLPSSD